MIVELGARRRWPFRREGPSGSALLLEVSRSVGCDRENRVLGLGRGSGSRSRYSWYQSESLIGLDMAPHKSRQARELIEQQDNSDMPTQGKVQEEVSIEELVAQP
ncbi:hypothetical protein Taro_025797 [Colocasia esculenta]|uniref:Uncharacterized protein n=1 Tax=Colocasia esculenta TaxID=4460 RepID=A0A843VD99_COLES|nr:hypothetical protein [Colocasia esculenta]